MGMFIPHDPLRRVIFTLSVHDYERALLNAVDRVSDSIKVRKTRIEKIRKDNELDDATYLQAVQQFTSNNRAAYYTVSSASLNAQVDDTSSPVPDRTIAAGVVASLMAEEAEMRKEAGALATFQLHQRNVKSATTIELSEDDLKFLGL